MGRYIPHSYSGRADNVVFLHTAKATYMRGRPSKYVHTKATKKAATIFGQAASIGAQLRAGLLPGLGLKSYNGFQNRLTVALSAWLRSNPAGEQFKPTNNIDSLMEVEYNEKGRKIDSLWKINRVVRLASTGVLEIVIPGFNPVKDLSVAPGTINVSFSVSAASCSPDGTLEGSASFEYSFEYTNQSINERIINLELPTQAGCLLVTAASLKCRIIRYGKLVQIKPDIYGPAGIISAMFL